MTERPSLTPLARTMNPFPLLPAEILRAIIEEAAKHHCTALALVLACKLFNKWAAPILYQVVRATSQNDLKSLHLSCRNARLVNVQTLSLSVLPMFCGAVDGIIEACTGVKRLLIIIGNDPPLHSSMKPWMVNVVNYSSSSLNWGSSNLLISVTHLYVEYGFRLSIDACTALKTVTHLAFSGGVWDDVYDDHYLNYIQQLLKNPSLKILLVCGPVHNQADTVDFLGRGWVELAKIQDQRLLVRHGLRWDVHMQLFESGGSIWDNVNQFKDWGKMVRDRDT